jgi:tetratricopeptide (TPR) repeat protein
MGPQRQRLAVLAQVIVPLSALLIVLLAAPTAARAEENKQALARSLFNLAISEYQAKQYDAAAASLAKSYALDPRPDALYALAQAERLANRCKDALVHYEQLLDESKDDKIILRVKENIEICKQIEAGKPAPAEKKQDVAQRDAPTIEYRTIVRTERKRDVLSIVLFVGGGIAVSGGAAGYLYSRELGKDADRAQSLAEYNDKYDQSRQLRWISYATAGVGVSLLAIATIRVIGGDDSETRRVAVTPVRGGSVVSWSARW